MAASDALDALAAAVSDGVSVDWHAVENTVSSSDELRVLRNLRVISTLSELHRTGLDSVADEDTLQKTAPLADSVALPRWGCLALLDRLGGGVYGDVFRAIDTRLDREVALKLLKRAAGEEDALHVLNEARLLARIRHPNVVMVYGADLIDGHVGLWMELISGETLDRFISCNGPMNATEAALVGLDLCRAIGAVHSAGLLHRDIKAQNVMREVGGRYVLMDFGTGHEVSDEGQGRRRTGTPLYLAPEILGGEAATAQSDIYAIGVLLFYLTTGRYPVAATSVSELLAAHADDRHQRLTDVRPDLPSTFRDVVTRAVAPNPSARFRSAAEMADALSRSIATSVRESKRKGHVGLVAGITTSLVAAMFVWLSNGGKESSIAGPPVVAVLPFQDLSHDQTLGYLATGLADLLITDLGQSAQLNVLARTSSQEFVGIRGISVLARDYGVSAVVEGAVESEGERLRTSVRLVNANTGAVVWSKQYFHMLPETLNMERDVVGQVAKALRVGFDSASLHRKSAINAQAFEMYFRGWSEYFLLNRDSMKKAEDLFASVIDASPDFAPAHAALAQVKFVRVTSFREPYPGRDYAATLADAASSIARARDLDPRNGYAAAVAGLIHYTGYWDWATAEKHFAEAIELNPSDAQARGLYAQLLMAQHRLEPALLEARRAQQLDPLNLTRLSQVAICLYYLRRFDESLTESQRILVRDPASSIARLASARVLSALARHDEAIAMLSTGGRTQEAPIRAELARILAAAGRRDDALAAMDSLVEAYQVGALAPDYLAYVHLALGERGRALDLLSEAVDRRSPSVIWVKVDPRFDELRRDNRFAAIMKSVGLEQ